jgi:hypothetical protein
VALADARPGVALADARPGVALGPGRADSIHCAAMAVLSNVLVVAAFVVLAALGTGIVIALVRLSGRLRGS